MCDSQHCATLKNVNTLALNVRQSTITIHSIKIIHLVHYVAHTTSVFGKIRAIRCKNQTAEQRCNRSTRTTCPFHPAWTLCVRLEWPRTSSWLVWRCWVSSAAPRTVQPTPTPRNRSELHHTHTHTHTHIHHQLIETILNTVSSNCQLTGCRLSLKDNLRPVNWKLELVVN